MLETEVDWKKILRVCLHTHFGPDREQTSSASVRAVQMATSVCQIGGMPKSYLWCIQKRYQGECGISWWNDPRPLLHMFEQAWSGMMSCWGVDIIVQSWCREFFSSWSRWSPEVSSYCAMCTITCTACIALAPLQHLTSGHSSSHLTSIGAAARVPQK